MEDNFKIIYYKKENGKSPFLDFLFDQDENMRLYILSNIDILKLRGNRACLPLSKKIDKHIYELRILHNGVYSRVLYFFFINKTIVITNGFIKKRNKTPRKEIDKANEYRNDWLRRYKHE